MQKEKYVIGVDFGTDSVRSIIINAASGEEITSSIFNYPRWKKGLYCNPFENIFRQHPADYIEGLEFTLKECISKVGNEIAANIKGISIDTTGSTPVAVNKEGIPLSLIPAFAHNPNAMFVLWKDHSSIKEAEEINRQATKFDTNYLQFVGGIYSSEWFWAKLLHIVRVDKEIAENIYSFVEHCDWIPFLLTGGNDIDQMRRGVCSAGHKALWAEVFNGLPPDDFFSSVDPLLKGFTKRLFTETYTADKAAGTISKEWATKLNLPDDIIVGVGAFDCHMGAVGGQIEPYYLSKVMGTSTCDMMVVPVNEVGNNLIKGICGQVNGSIIPNLVGMEAGQSAFGDAYAWFRNLLSWPLQQIEDENLREQLSNNIIANLSDAAARLPLNENDELALDWLNGRRTPDANQLLKGAFINLNLGSNAPQLFKALVEATCFGSKAIVERFMSEGIPVKGIIALGGVAKKSSYVMQVMADVLNMPIRVHKSEQTCAAGAAMFAATAAGIYNKVEDAMIAMGQGFETTYQPDQAKVEFYSTRYRMYVALGNHIDTNSIK